MSNHLQTPRQPYGYLRLPYHPQAERLLQKNHVKDDAQQDIHFFDEAGHRPVLFPGFSQAHRGQRALSDYLADAMLLRRIPGVRLYRFGPPSGLADRLLVVRSISRSVEIWVYVLVTSFGADVTVTTLAATPRELRTVPGAMGMVLVLVAGLAGFVLPLVLLHWFPTFTLGPPVWLLWLVSPFVCIGGSVGLISYLLIGGGLAHARSPLVQQECAGLASVVQHTVSEAMLRLHFGDQQTASVYE